jgi:cobalt-zinc-cadmium efflux system membrane fusion protein
MKKSSNIKDNTIQTQGNQSSIPRSFVTKVPLSILLAFGIFSLMVVSTGCTKDEQDHGKDWCKGHGVPESKCTICHPKLIAKYKQAGDWCKEHRLPESICPKCNPGRKPTPKRAGSVQTSANDWCKEHGLPESKCTKCHPKLIAKYKKSGDWCKGHGFPESVCPSCNPAPLPPGMKKRPLVVAGTQIRFRSKETEKAAGIQVIPATHIQLGKSLTCTAKIDFNRNRFAEVRSPIPALLHRLRVDVGQVVKKGRPLFILSSARVSALKAQMNATKEALSIAKIALSRQLRFRKQRIATALSVEKARLQVAKANAKLGAIRQSLRIGGISILSSAGYFYLLSPLSGKVITRPAVTGSQAGPGVLLATLADTRTMWAILNLNEWQASFVRVGQKVSVRVSGIASRVFSGKLTWLASHVDPRTRIVHARVKLKSHGLLRANQFGRATIQISGGVGGVSVPLKAVQRTEKASVVFVRMKPGLYETRLVQLGRSDGRRVQVKGKVKAGDQVVTTGAFLLRTELSKSSIGAGCCEVKKPGGE